MAILNLDNDGFNAGPFVAVSVAAGASNIEIFVINESNSVLRMDVAGPAGVTELTTSVSELTIPANDFVSFTASNSDSGAHTVDFTRIRTAHGTSAQSGMRLITAQSV